MNSNIQKIRGDFNIRNPYPYTQLPFDFSKINGDLNAEDKKKLMFSILNQPHLSARIQAEISKSNNPEQLLKNLISHLNDAFKSNKSEIKSNASSKAFLLFVADFNELQISSLFLDKDHGLSSDLIDWADLSPETLSESPQLSHSWPGSPDKEIPAANRPIFHGLRIESIASADLLQKPKMDKMAFKSRKLPAYSSDAESEILNKVRGNKSSIEDWHRFVPKSESKLIFSEMHRSFNESNSSNNQKSYDDLSKEIGTLIDQNNIYKAAEKTVLLRHWLADLEQFANGELAFDQSLPTLTPDEKKEIADMRMDLEILLDQLALTLQILHNHDHLQDSLPKIIAQSEVMASGNRSAANLNIPIYTEVNKLIDVPIRFEQDLDGLSKQVAMLAGFHANLVPSARKHQDSKTNYLKKLATINQEKLAETEKRLQLVTRFFDSMLGAKNKALDLAPKMGTLNEKEKSKDIAEKIEEISDLFKIKISASDIEIDANLVKQIENKASQFKTPIYQILFSTPVPPAAYLSTAVSQAETSLHQRLNVMTLMTQEYLSLHEKSTEYSAFTTSYIEKNKQEFQKLNDTLDQTLNWLEGAELSAAVNAEKEALKAFEQNPPSAELLRQMQTTALNLLGLDESQRNSASLVQTSAILETKLADSKKLIKALQEMIELQKTSFEQKYQYEELLRAEKPLAQKTRLVELENEGQALLRQMEQISAKIKNFEISPLFEKNNLKIEGLKSNQSEFFSLPESMVLHENNVPVEYLAAKKDLTPSSYQFQAALALLEWTRVIPAAHQSYFYAQESRRLYAQFHQETFQSYNEMASRIDKIYDEDIPFEDGEKKIQSEIEKEIKFLEKQKNDFVTELKKLGDKYHDPKIETHSMIDTVEQIFLGVKAHLSTYRTEYLSSLRALDLAEKKKNLRTVNRSSTVTPSNAGFENNFRSENADAENIHNDYEEKIQALKTPAENFLNSLNHMEDEYSENKEAQMRIAFFESCRKNFRQMTALQDKIRREQISINPSDKNIDKSFSQFHMQMFGLEQTLQSLLDEIDDLSSKKEFHKIFSEYKERMDGAAQELAKVKKDGNATHSFRVEQSKANIIFLNAFERELDSLERKYRNTKLPKHYAGSFAAYILTENTSKLVRLPKNTSLKVSAEASNSSNNNRSSANGLIAYKSGKFQVELSLYSYKPLKGANTGTSNQSLLDQGSPTKNEVNPALAQGVNSQANGSASEVLEQSTVAGFQERYKLKNDSRIGLDLITPYRFFGSDESRFGVSYRQTQGTRVTSHNSDNVQYDYLINKTTQNIVTNTPTAININNINVPAGTTVSGVNLTMDITGQIFQGNVVQNQVLAAGAFDIFDASGAILATNVVGVGNTLTFKAYNNLAVFSSGTTATYRLVYKGIPNSNPPPEILLNFNLTPNGADFDLTYISHTVTPGNVNIQTVQTVVIEDIQKTPRTRYIREEQTDNFTRQMADFIAKFGYDVGRIFWMWGAGIGYSQFSHSKRFRTSDTNALEKNNNLDAFPFDQLFGFGLQTEGQKSEEAKIMRNTLYAIMSFYIQYNPNPDAKGWLADFNNPDKKFWEDFKDALSADLDIEAHGDISGNKNSFAIMKFRSELKLFTFSAFSASLSASAQKIIEDKSKRNQSLSVGNFSSLPKTDLRFGPKFYFDIAAHRASLTLGAYEREYPIFVAGSPNAIPQQGTRPYIDLQYTQIASMGAFAKFEMLIKNLELLKGADLSFWIELRARVNNMKYDYYKRMQVEDHRIKGISEFDIGATIKK